jgi:hypothetical protein
MANADFSKRWAALSVCHKFLAEFNLPFSHSLHSIESGKGEDLLPSRHSAWPGVI